MSDLDAILGPDETPEAPPAETPVEELPVEETGNPVGEAAEPPPEVPEETPAESPAEKPAEKPVEAVQRHKHSLHDVHRAMELSGGNLTREAIDSATPEELQSYIAFQEQRQAAAPKTEKEPDPEEPLGDLDPDLDPAVRKRLLKAEQAAKDNAELRKQLDAIREDIKQREQAETFSTIDDAVESLPEEVKAKFGENGKRSQAEFKRLNAVLVGTGVDFNKIRTLPRGQFKKLVRQSYEDLYGPIEQAKPAIAEGEVKRVTKQQLAAGATAKPTSVKRDEAKQPAESVSILDLILDS